jgi:TetR/AcrR family transcriptional regulator, transcriptional repressor of aconitase
MPKVVDHDAHRRDLAAQAAEVFSERGYSALGMRELAEALGVSKSSLYHYFPGKEALFRAATEHVVDQDWDPEGLPSAEAPAQERARALMDVIRQVEDRFPGELSLMVDYLRGRSPSEVRDDPCMELANRRFLELVTQVVGPADARSIASLLMGVLLQRFLDGRATSMDEVEEWLAGVLER